jgi:hypothetical protein
VSVRLLRLVGVTLIFWLLVALPARWLGGGDLAVLHSGTAGLLCLVPGVAVLLWAGMSSNEPEQQLTVALGSVSLRMFFVLGGAFLLERTLPLYHGSLAFWIWVLVFYLFTLALETFLLLTGRAPGRNP